MQILARNPSVQSIQLREIALSRSLQERIDLTIEERTLIAASLELKEALHLPFWDCLLRECMDRSVAHTRLFVEAQHHQTNKNEGITIETARVSAEQLRELASGIRGENMLAISSLVSCSDGGQKHIPMLDLHCRVSHQNQDIVEEVVNLLDIGGGYILESGKSYHFYGVRLLSTDDLSSFLARALLFGPIVDRAWIAHQMIETSCALRISPRQLSGNPPMLVSTLRPVG